MRITVEVSSCPHEIIGSVAVETYEEAREFIDRDSKKHPDFEYRVVRHFGSPEEFDF